MLEKLPSKSSTGLTKNSFDNSDELQGIIFEYLNNNFIQRIKGIVLEHDRMLDRILVDSLEFIGNYYVCCNVFFDFNEEYSMDTQVLNMSFSTQIVSKNIAAMLSENYKIYALDLNNNLFVYIINLEREADKIDLKRLF